MEYLIYFLLWFLPIIFNGLIMYYIVHYSYGLYDSYSDNKLAIGASFIPIIGAFIFVGLFVVLMVDLFNRTFDKIYTE